jgi:hypothetical protein
MVKNFLAVCGIALPTTGLLFSFSLFNHSVSSSCCTCCLFTSVVDPDPHGVAFIWLSWIRIRIGNAEPDPGALKFTKIYK